MLMDPNGFAGAILYIDLSSGEIKRESINPQWIERFVGGWGINMKLAYDLISPEIAPLSPENPIIFGSGLLVGTNAPGASKLFVTTKVPQNGAIATAAAGGGLGHMLKWAGYDYLVITGRSKKPVYLHILDDKVEIRDASRLWGKDITETTDGLLDEYGSQYSVMAIGQAGENLGNLSFAYVDKIASLGKGGLGAILGSKNLKAMVALGTKGLKVADLKGFRKLTSGIIKGVKNYPHRERWMKLSTMYSWESFPDVSLPVKYWTELSPPGEANELYGVNVLNKVRKASVACLSCPIACKKVVQAKDGDYKGLETHVSHYDGAAISWGLQFDLRDYSRGIKLTDLANRYGIEEMAASDIMNFAIHIYEQGIITDKDTQGLTLKRDFHTAKTLLDQMAQKQGLGGILVDGYPAAIKAFGPEAEKQAVQIKGHYTIFDPRMIFGTEAFAGIVSTRGGSHVVPGLGPTSFVPGRPIEQLKRHCERIGVPDDGIERIFFDPTGLNIARFTKYIEDRFSVFNIFGICSRHAVAMNYNSENLTELYSLATGNAATSSDLSRFGEMIWNMDKVINAREGFTRADDTIPDRWFEPFKIGDKKMVLMDYYRQKTLTREDMVKLLDDYYDERGWDIKNGLPTKERLVELGLEDMIQAVPESG